MEYAIVLVVAALGLLTAWRLSNWCVFRFCDQWRCDECDDGVEADEVQPRP